MSDGGGEYTSKEFKQYLKEEGIIQKITPPYTPQRNGVAERFNRTIIEKVRCMLKTNNLNKEFWGEAANTANRIRNCSPTKTKQKCPEEEFSGQTPDLTKLKTFGCKVMIKNKKEGTKLDDKATEGLMLGYNEDNKTFRVWDLKRKKVTVTRDLSIFEKTKPNQKEQNKEESSEESDENKSDKEEISKSEEEKTVITIESDESESDDDSEADESKEDSEKEKEKIINNQNNEEIRDFVILIDNSELEKVKNQEEKQKVKLRRSTREKRKPNEFGKVKLYLTEETDDTTITY